MDASTDAGSEDAGTEDSGTPDAGDAGPSLTLSNAPLPVATELASYAFQFAPAGGVGTYHYAMDGGVPGFTLTSGGNFFTGSAPQAGSFTFSLTVSDDDVPANRLTNDYTFTVRRLLRVATPTQMNGAIGGDSYNEPLQATGGTGPFTWRVPDGGLPAWATINGTSLTGNAAAGTFNFTLEVTDSSLPTPQVATRRTQISVLALGVCLSPTFLTPLLPDGRVGEPFSYTLRACGLGNPNWSKDGGAIFALSNQPPIGVLTANPLDAGDYTLSTTATATLSATKGFTVHVDP